MNKYLFSLNFNYTFFISLENMNVKNQDLLYEIIYNLLYNVEALNFSKQKGKKI